MATVASRSAENCTVWDTDELAALPPDATPRLRSLSNMEQIPIAVEHTLEAPSSST